jgi:hypothetical protein
MCKLIFVTLLVLCFSCASPKYVYYFDSYKSAKNDSAASIHAVDPTSLTASNNLSIESLEPEIQTERTVLIDTGKVANDTLPQREKDTKYYSRETKQAKKRAYIEKKKAYLDARKNYQRQGQVDWPNQAVRKEARRKAHDEMTKAYAEAKVAYAATKNRRLDGYAILGAVLLTVGFLSISYPVGAIWFLTLGLISSIIGLKSRIWGLSAAMLIATGVVLTLYTILSMMVIEE